MRTLSFSTLAALLILLAGVSDGFAQFEDGEEVDLVENPRKLGQTGMQFLSVSVDPRAAALGNAVTAQEKGALAQFYNPATMAHADEVVDIGLGHNQWIAGIGYNFGALAFRPADGVYGTFALHAMSVDYGSIQGTVRWNNEQGFRETGMISPSAFVGGLSYARAITDRFSVGGTAKLARQNLGSAITRVGEYSSGGNLPDEHQLAKNAAVFDFGILYRTGFRSLNFAVNIRNFSGELTYVEDSFELPLDFRIGLSMDMTDLAPTIPDAHSFQLSADATHPRSWSEQVKVGGEYSFMDMFFLRAGYIYPTSEEGINLGAGIQQDVGGLGLGIDYGYSSFGVFGNVHRFSLRLGLN